jgi:hypothetical protein
MNKKLLIPIIVLILFLAAAVVLYSKNKSNANDKKPELVEAPPSISQVNSLALSKRPYVEMIPHPNPSRCSGVDLNINNLRNDEKKVEYELEYTTEKLIQGVFGRRDFSEDPKSFKPLEFGTCSKGTCRCDDDITGGSLKLTFEGNENYVLKGDFAVQNVGENDGVIESRDARLTLNVGSSLSKTTDVLLMSTFGLPKELDKKVILGPYGIFTSNNEKLKSPIKVTLQSKDISTSDIQFYDGQKWNTVNSQIEGDKATFEISQLGTIVLTEK